MKGQNTFNLKENPHDWLGAEPADLNIDMKEESFVRPGLHSPAVDDYDYDNVYDKASTHLQLRRSPWCGTTWLCHLEICN